MRLLLASTAVALLFGLSPVSAMCSGDQAGGMCGKPATSKSMSEKSDWARGTKQGPARTKVHGHGYVSLLQEHGDDGRHEVR
jgi:hypothetical protein